MSSMLEQAIVDAAKLREAALKNAEASIIEKYAPEIKSAVESLLEQEVGDEMMPPAPEEDIDVPPAYVEDEQACPCPEDGEKVEVQLSFSLEDLEDMARGLAPAGEPEDHMDVADEVVPDELEIPEDMLEEAHCGQRDDDALEEDVPEYDEREHGEIEVKDGPGPFSITKDGEMVQTESNDDIVLDEDILTALAEELNVDIVPEMSGWAGRPQREMEHMAELELARLAGTEAREKQEALEKAVKSLEESNTNLKKSNKTLKETVLKMKSAFDDMSTSNAKLLYTNRILSSPSLNERQKENIVEAISKAGSVDEAKVIYDTLQSTGGASSKKAVPQSLSEAIKRSSTTVLPRRQSVRTTDTAIDRLQILAGIKHNK